VDVEYRRLAEDPAPDSSRPLGKFIKTARKMSPLFWICVVVPTLLSILYFGLFASDVYVSESRFVVRSPDKPASSGFGILLKTAGFSNSGDEIFAAQDFVKSRDALRALNRNDSFVNAYTRSDISVFNRFGTLGFGDTFEELYKYYLGKVGIDHNSASSISTLTVKSYDPQSAYRFNEQLLEMAEATVNQLNTRGRQDLIRFAQKEVDNAQARSRAAAIALARYRNTAGVVDPEKQAAVQLQMVSKLQDQLITTKSQLAQLRKFAPENSQVEALEVLSDSLESEIKSEMGGIAGDNRSLSSNAVQFQRLMLESQFADKQLAAAMASLEEAQNEARRKQAYVERIVQPNLPDESLEPRRLRGIVSTFVLGMIAWGILGMFLAGIREHKA